MTKTGPFRDPKLSAWMEALLQEDFALGERGWRVVAQLDVGSGYDVGTYEEEARWRVDVDVQAGVE